MKYNKLMGRVVEMYGTKKTFAEAIKETPATVSNKLNGITKLDVDDIQLYCEALLIEPSEIPNYFFQKEVK